MAENEHSQGQGHTAQASKPNVSSTTTNSEKEYVVLMAEVAKVEPAPNGTGEIVRRYRTGSTVKLSDQRAKRLLERHPVPGVREKTKEDS